jgi:hypothetical protein
MCAAILAQPYSIRLRRNATLIPSDREHPALPKMKKDEIEIAANVEN